jgi:hypothetical protein
MANGTRQRRAKLRLATLIWMSLLVAAVIGIAVVFYLYFRPAPPEITNFAECKQSAGSKLLEIYPEICMTAGGKSFTNPDQAVDTPLSN